MTKEIREVLAEIERRIRSDERNVLSKHELKDLKNWITDRFPEGEGE